MSPIVIFFWSL